RTYRSVKATHTRLDHAYCMWRAFNLLRNLQARKRIGALEKRFSPPPHRCRHAWQDNVYSQMSAAFATKISEPRPIPQPSGKWNASTASSVSTAAMGTAKYRK